MKKLVSFFTFAVLVFAISSCTQDNENQDFIELLPKSTHTVGNFNVDLLSSNEQNGGGNYEWIWKVQQINIGGPSNPGISHIGFVEQLCIGNENIVEVCWSTDGVNWVCDNAVYATDPSSRNCGNDKVLKIDYGQGAINYYKIVVNEVFCVGEVPVVLKYGRFCTVGTVQGIGCDDCEQEPPTGCDTAFLVGNNTFIDLGIGNNWGWAQFIEDADGVYTYDFHAGAGQNDLNNGYKAGEVTITVDGTDVHFAIDITAPNVTLEDTHVYVSGSAPTTAAPGQYSNGTNGSFPNYTYGGGDLWVIVHGVVCEDE